MKFYLKFLLAVIILVAGNNAKANAHFSDEQHDQITSKSDIEVISASFTTLNDFASFNITSAPTEQKKGNPSKDIAEIDEVEEENESRTFKKSFDEVNYFTSLFYTELLKQYFLCADNRLSSVKLCPYISPESSYLLFQVFRI